MRLWVILVLLVLSAPVFAVSDYAREKRWADEVVPGILVGDPIYLEQKNGHEFLGIYTEAANARMGVVVVHGMGIHPDWGLIGTLRQQLAEQGYTTLAIQMPILAADAKPERYPPTFPEAVERLHLAVAYLKAKGYQRIAIVSHSMGARMSYEYLVNSPAAVSAWVAMGMYGTDTYAGLTLPVLDLDGANEPVVTSGLALKRKASLKGNAASRQVVIPNADHFYTGQEEAMVKAVKDFLDGLK